MKKSIFFLSAAALMATSCSDDFGYNNANNVVEPKGNCKIVATYELGQESNETRTEFNWSGSTPKYIWSQGDGLGVFNAGVTDNTNAHFGWVGNNTNAGKPGYIGVFYGDIDAMAGNDFYIYYPYDSRATLSSSTLSVYINQNQNFNHIAAATPSIDINTTPNGSFSAGEAPAVSLGTYTPADEEEDAPATMTVDLQAVASYMVLPVVGYTVDDIKTVYLEVLDSEGTSVPLSGMINVDMSTALTDEGKFKPEVNPSLYTALAGDGQQETAPTNNYIALNCGKGVPLDPETPVCFWFVVPADLNLDQATINLYFDDNTPGNGAKPDCTKTFAKGYWNGKKANQNGSARNFMGRNEVRYIGGPNGFWQYNQTNGYLIDSELKFIEYANLVSTSSKDIDILIENWKQYNEKVNELTDVTEQAKYRVFTDLGEMIEWDGENFKSVKDGYIIANLGLNNGFANVTSSLTTAFGNLGGAMAGGSIPQYITTVYGTMMETSPYLNTIGGGQSFVLNGKLGDDYTGSINELTIKGNGMFSTTTAIAVNDLAINNVKVNVAENTAPYYFLAEKVFQSPIVKFSSISVNGDCGFIPENTNGALFDKISTLAYSKNSVSDITNNTGMLYANMLVVNDVSGFDFTINKGAAVANFGKIGVITDKQPVFIVSGQAEAEALLSNIWNNSNASATLSKFDINVNKFSILDNLEKGTSYWTGMAYQSSNTGYAEDLAYAVQSESGNAFTMTTFNLNLMGKTSGENPTVLNTWWANKISRLFEFTCNDNANTISNIYIDGTNGNDEEPITDALTLFGRNSTVIGKLTINGISIVNEKNDKAYIGAVSIWPTNSSDITLSGLSVTNNVALVNEDYGNIVGGAYTTITSPSSLSLTYIDEPEINTTAKTIMGYAAGRLRFNTNSNSNISNFVNSVKTSGVTPTKVNQFGIVKIYVDPKPGNVIKINLSGFPAGVVGNEETNMINANSLVPVGTTTAEGSQVLIFNQGRVNEFTYKNGKYTWTNGYTADGELK